MAEEVKAAGAAQPAQKQEGAQQPQQQQQPQARPCPQDCRLCGMNQQIFCSTQMVFNLSRAMQEARQQISLLEMAVDGIREQLQPKKEEAQLSIPFSE